LDAVVRSGGKQYRVHEGSVLEVATLDAEPGSQVELRDVLLLSDDGKVTVGAPNIDGAVVVADVVEHGKGKKVVSFKYKAKTRYRRKKGHRQGFTRLSVTQIRIGDAPAPARRRAAAAPAEEVAPAEEAPAESTPRRRARAAPSEATAGENTAATPRRRRAAKPEGE
jgi:large subunit ribosomal protein L21